MVQMLELPERLTEDELDKMRAYAVTLVAGRVAFPERPPVSAERKVSYDGWAGCLAHVHPEMSDAEFSRLMLDERVREALE